MSPRRPALAARVRSAIWAAYGDVLGFPTELVNLSGVRRRIGSDEITTPVAWTRRVGGKFGVQVELPAGVYSDDTQLRLATSRSISGSGRFDVEAFSKIELPIWPSYALGGGVGTRAAATALAKRHASWSGHFDANARSYMSGGGNGAAMRIQPHVWAAPRPERPETYMTDVIRNSVCTHGHFRGIVGACFHAALLGLVLAAGKPQGPESWFAAAEAIQQIPKWLREDDELAQFWVPAWERLAGETVEDACREVLRELASDLVVVAGRDERGPREYGAVAAEIGATESSARGSGIKTAVLAAVVARLDSDSPEESLITAANALGTDTDTIATMAGALIGALVDREPGGPVLDAEYIRGEATRLGQIARREEVAAFEYPDLLRWSPPRSQLEVVGTAAGGLAVAGLGPAEKFGKIHPAPGQDDSGWQFVRLSFGQTLLIKRRMKLKELPPTALPYSRQQAGSAVMPTAGRENGATHVDTAVQPSLFGAAPDAVDQGVRHAAPDLDSLGNLTLHEATKIVYAEGLDPLTVGSFLMAFADRDDGVELAIGFAAIVAKAKKAQDDRRRRGDS